MRYKFGEYVLDSDSFELAKSGEAIAVEPQVFRLLIYLLENRERVISKDELIAEIWDGRIVSDAAMHSRINAARAAVGDTGKAQAKIKTYSKRGIRFVAPVNLLTTENCDLSSPEVTGSKHSDGTGEVTGLSPSEESDQKSSGLHEKTVRSADRKDERLEHPKGSLILGSVFLIALGGLAVAYGLGLFGTSKSQEGSSSEISFPLKMAVLPFENLSNDINQTYFGEGLADDLITDLAGLEDLKVAPRHSSFRFAGQDLAAATIADELSVRFIVEGSVRKFGDELRINAKLLDPFENTVLWAERYDGSVNDIFKFQAAMLRGITSSVGLRTEAQDLDQSPKRGTNEIAAYDAYLRGMAYIAERRVLDVANVDAAEEAFGEAIRIDPSYALAYAGLAWTKWLRSESIFHAKGLEDVAFELAERSLDLDENALAHRTLAKKYFSTLTSFIQFNRDPEAPDVLADLGSVLPFVGRAPEALEMYRRAVELNPNHPGWYHGASTLGYLFTRELNDALREANLWIGGVPKQSPPYLFKSAILGLLEREREAYEAYAIFNEMQGNANYSLYYVDRKWPMKSKDKEYFLEGLNKAGIK